MGVHSAKTESTLLAYSGARKWDLERPNPKTETSYFIRVTTITTAGCVNKLASLEATLVRNYDPPTD